MVDGIKGAFPLLFEALTEGIDELVDQGSLADAFCMPSFLLLSGVEGNAERRRGVPFMASPLAQVVDSRIACASTLQEK